MDNLIKVQCIVLPTGETLWFESDPRYQYLIIKKWRSEHPEFDESGCTMAVSQIVMPRENYNKIKAQIGAGAFEFPEKE